ncbi:MAG TPA: EamA family transporter [Ruminococcaceae bacterium]|nr:EamA family transporter [Oscillospiraceae bacterium]
MKEKQSTAHLEMIIAMLIFGTVGIFRRCIPLSSALLACSRGVLGAGFLAGFVKLKKQKLFHGIGGKNTAFLVLTGAVIGANWMLLFEAYRCTSVATATLCYYMQPTIVLLVSPLLFRERLTLKKMLCALAALGGMVMVSGVADSKKPTGDDISGILFGLGAAALYALAVILNKKISVDDAYGKTVIQLLSASAVLLPYLLLTDGFTAVSLSPFSVLLLVLVGVVHTGIAYALYFAGMKKLQAQSVAMLSYIDPVSALILSALILHERLTLFGLLGAVLIIGSAFVSELNFKQKKIG